MLYELLIATLILVSTCSILLLVTLIKLRRLVRAYSALLKVREESSIDRRIRKRYVVFATVCEERVRSSELKDAVSAKFKELFSESTYYKASPQLLFFDENTERGVYRVAHLYVDYFIVALGLVKTVENKRCVIVPLRTTGTLRKARELARKLKF